MGAEMPLGRVTIVVDENIGARAVEQAALGPVWIVRSTENEQAVATLWANAAFPPDHLTIFDGAGSAEASLVSILDTVDEHHYGWTDLEVIGVELSKKIEKALRTYGQGTCRNTGAGFIFTR
jgi:hypothetical protein